MYINIFIYSFSKVEYQTYQDQKKPPQIGKIHRALNIKILHKMPAKRI